jgi:hypothetical protein
MGMHARFRAIIKSSRWCFGGSRENQIRTNEDICPKHHRRHTKEYQHSKRATNRRKAIIM